MMSRVQPMCFVLFALALLAITFVGASSSGGHHVLSPEAQQFRELLDTLDPNTLHEILHEHFKDKYQHGVYQGDKSALEALHKQNAAVATSLVQLAKRQGPEGGNGSSVVTTTAIETTEVTTTITSTNTPSPPPVEPTPTPTPSDTPPTTSEPPVTPTPTPSDPPPPATTTSESAPPTTTSSDQTSSSIPSTSVSSTLSTTTSARTTTSRVPTSYSNTSSYSTTSSFITSSTRSSTLSTTSSASSRTSAAEEQVTTSYVYTTTLANGAAIVTTEYTVVPADQVAQPTGNGGSQTNTAGASLQTGLANSHNQQIGGWTAGVGFLGALMAWGL